LTVAVDPLATPKVAAAVPLVSCGTIKVFVVVAAVILPVFTVAPPPGPANVKVPAAGTGAAYACPLSEAATSPVAPIRLSPNFLIFASFELETEYALRSKPHANR
jgi:hypothetical protein